MTDFHVHIGQYENTYFYPHRVFSALKMSGVDEAWFSSTTSCIYCKESDAANRDPLLCSRAPSAVFLYENIRDEIKCALTASEKLDFKVHPLFWVVPEVMFAGVGLDTVMGELNYDGFKIHTFAQNWNMLKEKNYNLVDSIFYFAQKHKKRILIHTGCEEKDSPRKFESFIRKYSSVKVQLAHCRNYYDLNYMLEKYDNVFVDCSASCNSVVSNLRDKFGTDKVLFGSDFPVLDKYSKDPTVKELSRNYNKYKSDL